MLARSMGFRANATAIEVPSSSSSVCSAARSSGKNGSWPVSAVQTPEYPAASAAWASRPALRRSNPITPSTFMAADGSGSTADGTSTAPGHGRRCAGTFGPRPLGSHRVQVDRKEVGDATIDVRSGVGQRAGRGHHRGGEPTSAGGRPLVHVGAGSSRRRWVHDGRVAVAGHQGPLAGGIRRGRDLPQHGRRQDLARRHPGLRGPGPAQGRCDRVGSVQRQSACGLVSAPIA